MSASVPSSSFKSAVAGDFDGDGHEDVLLVSDDRAEVAWNGPEGLSHFLELLAAEGAFGDVLWDDQDRTLWCARYYPERIEAWTFEGRLPRRIRNFQGNPRKIRLAPGQGLTALDREDAVLELLFTNGDEEVLIPDASTLLDGALVVGERGERLLLLQDKESGKLGVSIGLQEAWTPVDWWASTEGTGKWEWYRAANGEVQVMGTTPEQLWYRSLDGRGITLDAWSPSTRTQGCRFWWSPASSDSTLEVCIRRSITTDLRHLTLHRRSGKVIDEQPLQEVSVLRTLVAVDLDGDGAQDWMHPHEDGPEWMVYMPWGEGTRRLWWQGKNADGQSWPSPMTLTRPWKLAIGDLGDVRAVWIHHGDLYFDRNGHWTRISSVDDPADQTRPSPDGNMQPDASIHQLVVPYLDRGELPGHFGVAEIEPEEWHHLVFIRRDDLHTEVWLDGTCRFRGRSMDLRYQYNALLFGAAYGVQYLHHGAVTLDRVFLSGRQWTPEDIEAESQSLAAQVSPFTAEAWSFDGWPLAGEISALPLEMNSDPRWVIGRSGKAVSFDGKDDALRTFVSVPTEALTLSFHFRLDDPEATTQQTLIALYGMYNTDINIRLYPSSMLDRPGMPGEALGSPELFETTVDAWPSGTRPFIHAGHLHLMTDDGQVLNEGPLGWQPFPASDTHDEAPVTASWTAGGRSFAMAKEGRVLEWHDAAGWNGTALRASSHLPMDVIPATEGAFATLNGGWSWISGEGLMSFHPVDSLPPLRSISWTPFGDMITLGQRAATPWHPTSRAVALARGAEVFSTRPGWWFSMRHLLLLAPFILLLGWWCRSRYSARDEAASGLPTLEGIPPELMDLLKSLSAHAGQLLETASLDGIIGIGHLETDETRRARRARLIRECNDWSTAAMTEPVIRRERDPSDRRRSLYAIHPILAAIFEEESPGP